MANGRKTQAPVSERRTRPLCEPRPRDCDSARRRIRSIRGRAAHASRRLTASRFWDTHAVDIPDVRYARAGSVAIAFQVVGEGPRTPLLASALRPLLDLGGSLHASVSRPACVRAAPRRLQPSRDRILRQTERYQPRGEDGRHPCDPRHPRDRPREPSRKLGRREHVCSFRRLVPPSVASASSYNTSPRAEPRRPTTRTGKAKSGGSSGFARCASITVKESSSWSGLDRSIPR
jgi:hypothetical protein